MNKYNWIASVISKIQSHDNTYLQGQGGESFTISTINFSINGSNKRFFDKLYETLGLNQS